MSRIIDPRLQNCTKCYYCSGGWSCLKCSNPKSIYFGCEVPRTSCSSYVSYSLVENDGKKFDVKKERKRRKNIYKFQHVEDWDAM